MTTLHIKTRHVTKRGQRVKEYRLVFKSKGRVTFVTPQWYSRLDDLRDVTISLSTDFERGRVQDPKGLMT